ncbi:MAG: hypothetical protein A2277_19745 [Desulfobacterales bacterium RIFOXYA12_FULL_46_15]|nr:MAG: hypothetical protein A2277_19745 [Desulfobacterales bacterium RIFOXYA12_FULL_46_15]
MVELKLNKDQENFLLEVTTFNISTRYPDYKESFRKKATRMYIKGHIEKIEPDPFVNEIITTGERII